MSSALPCLDGDWGGKGSKAFAASLLVKGSMPSVHSSCLVLHGVGLRRDSDVGSKKVGGAEGGAVGGAVKISLSPAKGKHVFSTSLTMPTKVGGSGLGGSALRGLLAKISVGGEANVVNPVGS